MSYRGTARNSVLAVAGASLLVGGTGCGEHQPTSYHETTLKEVLHEYPEVIRDQSIYDYGAVRLGRGYPKPETISLLFTCTQAGDLEIMTNDDARTTEVTHHYPGCPTDWSFSSIIDRLLSNGPSLSSTLPQHMDIAVQIPDN